VRSVVKHFKWKPRGKRRLHEKPRRIERARVVEDLRRVAQRLAK
jgi:hypothetical protein